MLSLLARAGQAAPRRFWSRPVLQRYNTSQASEPVTRSEGEEAIYKKLEEHLSPSVLHVEDVSGQCLSLVTRILA